MNKNLKNSKSPENNIAQLKRQIADLQQSEAFFRAITHNSSDIIFIVDEKANIAYANPSVERFLGYKPEELIGKSGFAFILPSDMPRAIFDFGKSLLTRETEIPNSFGVRHKDGSIRILEGVGVNLLHDPVVKGFVMTVRDVTDRRKAQDELETYRKQLEDIVDKRTAEITQVNIQLLNELAERQEIEKALKESEEKYRDFIDNAPIGVGIIDMSGKIQYINKRIEELMDWKREEMIGKDGFGLEELDEESRRRLIERFAARVEGDKPRLMEIPIARKNKPPLWVEVITTILKKDNVPVGAQMVFVNITERKQAEEERKAMMERLHRAEKMESLGTLAGGVAHDLNNVLGVLVGYTELLLSEMDDTDPLKKHLFSIMKSSTKASAIIQDLLTLARRGVPVSEVVNLNQIVEDFFQTPEFERLNSYHPRVRYHKELDKDLLNVRGSPVHLGKTVMNLVSNAVEAITDEGDVVISTHNCYIDSSACGPHDVQEGDYVLLTIRDSGQGIPPKDIDKIFEPFYTKKVMGRSGTGLGLAVVWGTVKDHKGHIDVASVPGKGTTFTLYFPATQEALKRPSKAATIDSYMGSGESILVVDDVREQREVATNMLSRLRYQITTVGSGEDAVSYLKNHTADVVVLDMLMDPGIDGLETYKRILEINPKQKAIIVSGYSETDRVKEALELGAGAYVRKPYILENIGTALRNTLAAM